MEVQGQTLKRLIVGIAFAGALFHIYYLGVSSMSMWPYRLFHLMFGELLVILTKPFWSGKKTKNMRGMLWDGVLFAAVLMVTAYFIVNIDRLTATIDFAPKIPDIVMCAFGVFILLEVTRRINGPAMPILAFFFIIYALLGKYIPGVAGHKGYPLGRLMTFEFGLNGVFGTSIGVSSTYVILFVLFGAVLKKTGGGRLFIDIAVAALGKYRGGPAKAAIFASAGMGTISGTAAGNVVTTGTFTIPLMRRVGYDALFAGAVEAVASTGGQIMPPIMGAAAFIMAETLGVEYSVVARAAVIPAVLYFLSVYVMVDLEAKKRGLNGIPDKELPDVKLVLHEVGHLIFPILILLYFLFFTDSSPLRAAMVAIIASLAIAMLRKTTRYGAKDVVEMFANGMKDAIGVIMACACAGLIVGVLSLTGLGSKMAIIVVSLAGNSKLLALILTMIVTMILGMGLPTTAAYIICSSVVVPALIKLGVPMISAHFFVFYFACLSAITPPVAISSYAAAGITGASADKTGYKAFKIGSAAFVVPFMFVYSSALLMEGSILLILQAAVTASIGIIFFGCAISGWLVHRANYLVRFLLLAAAFLMIDQGLVTDILGILIIAASYGLQKKVFIEKTAAKS